MGDVDGDGRAELVVGLEGGGNGWFVVLEDATKQFSEFPGGSWVQVDWGTYNAANGATSPALGDVDGDGRDEIALGLGKGGRSYVAVVDDATAGFGAYRTGWVQSGWGGYDTADGSTVPVLADLDADGKYEMIVHLGPAGRGYAQVLGGPGFSPQSGLGGANASGWVQGPRADHRLAR
jgi:hypothetical protein